MKHVREDLPDVQRRRPEVSAALASVLDRDDREGPRPPLPGRRRRSSPTSRRRWRSRPRARAPRPARRPRCCARCPRARGAALPLRLRFPIPLVVFLVVVLVGAGVIAAAGQGGRRPHASAAPGRARIKPAAGTQVVSLAAASAHDYDPLGDEAEHSADARLAVDRDPGTAWSTETYDGGTITKADTSERRRRALRRRRPAASRATR